MEQKVEGMVRAVMRRGGREAMRGEEGEGQLDGVEGGNHKTRLPGHVA